MSFMNDLIDGIEEEDENYISNEFKEMEWDMLEETVKHVKMAEKELERRKLALYKEKQMMCHFLANQLIGDEIPCIFDVYGQESIFWKIDMQDSSKKLEFMNILDIADDLLVDRDGHEVGGNIFGQLQRK